MRSTLPVARETRCRQSKSWYCTEYLRQLRVRMNMLLLRFVGDCAKRAVSHPLRYPVQVNAGGNGRDPDYRSW
ncbi:hypothetical protein GMLC_36570 [Geomonas limicola]|uniref:Uncharacterized protein n=1 Tax=Geomonas limicola TaxID=2740186 RepID=A0A6V8NBS9_9BACT|nr:hypothetical protein GMLC_36570 [Geomonas limicola]